MISTSAAARRSRRRGPLPFSSGTINNAIDDLIAERAGRHVPRRDDRVHVAIAQALDEMWGRSLVLRGPWSLERGQFIAIEAEADVDELLSEAEKAIAATYWADFHRRCQEPWPVAPGLVLRWALAHRKQLAAICLGTARPASKLLERYRKILTAPDPDRAWLPEFAMDFEFWKDGEPDEARFVAAIREWDQRRPKKGGPGER